MPGRRKRASSFGTSRPRRSSNDLGGLGRSRRRRTRPWRLVPLLGLVVVGLYYLTTRPAVAPPTEATQESDVVRDQELALGLASYRQIVAGSRIVASGPFADLVRDVGRQLAAVVGTSDVDWEFIVVEGDEMNAIGLPGGKVIVSAGLAPVAETPAGLAVVLSHVIAHTIARHGAERLGSIALSAPVPELDVDTRRLVMGAFGVGSRFGVLRPFSHAEEAVADRLGLHHLARACFDPTAAPRFWERARRVGGDTPPELLVIHPDLDAHTTDLHGAMGEALTLRAAHCRDQDSE